MKLDEYFAAGVAAAWVIDPRRRTARVYRTRDDFDELGADGKLSAPHVLPGFEVTLGQLFDRAWRGKAP